MDVKEPRPPTLTVDAVRVFRDARLRLRRAGVRVDVDALLAELVMDDDASLQTACGLAVDHGVVLEQLRSANAEVWAFRHVFRTVCGGDVENLRSGATCSRCGQRNPFVGEAP